MFTTVNDCSCYMWGTVLMKFIIGTKRKVTAFLMMVLYNGGIVTNGQQY